MENRSGLHFLIFSVVFLSRNNYQAIGQVNAATQENSAGVEMIEEMVVRIRELTGETT